MEVVSRNSNHLHSLRPTVGLIFYGQALPTSSLAVIMRSVKLRVLIGELNAGYQKMVLFIWCVGAQNQAVDGIVFAFGTRNIHQPLCSQRWPLQGMGHYQIVQERCILFPDLVLFIDNPLFKRVIVYFWNTNWILQRFTQRLQQPAASQQDFKRHVYIPIMRQICDLLSKMHNN